MVMGNDYCIIVIKSNESYIVVAEGSNAQLSDIIKVINNDKEENAKLIKVVREEYESCKSDIVALNEFILSKIQ